MAWDESKAWRQGRNHQKLYQALLDDATTAPARNAKRKKIVRPDELGVMIVQTKWRNRPAYIMKSAGRDPDENLLTWMRSFSVESGAPFFYEQQGERFGFGPPEFQHEMLVKLESGERLW